MLELDDTELSVELVEAMAYVCFRRERYGPAAVLLGSADRARSLHGLPRPNPVAALIDGYADPLREELGGTQWREAQAAGRELSPDAAFELATDVLTR